MKRNYHGFTLIELLVAVVIMGIVSAVILTSSASINKNARDSRRTGDIRNIQTALQQYYADQHFFPDDSIITPPLGSGPSLNISTATTLTSTSGNPVPPTSLKTYLSSVPKDPVISTTPYCYKAFVSSADLTTDCANNSTSASCQYYQLCAKLEGKPAPASSICTCGVSYNMKVTPL